MPIVNNLQPGSFQVDGAYIEELAAQVATPTGPNTDLVAIVGTANDGALQTPTPFGSGSAAAFAAFGNGTTLPNSIVDEAVNGAQPEGQQFIGVRVDDGTSTAATIAIVDGSNSPATLVTLTRTATGSYANGATAQLSLQSGTLTASPVFQLSIFYPGAVTEVFSGIVGYATAGGAFAAATFIANVIAAVNGTAPNSSPSAHFAASAGTSTAAPAAAGATYAASGGTNGTTTITTATLIGIDGNIGRTGIYALRGMVKGATVIVAGLTDLTVAQTLATFAQEESCIVLVAFASTLASNTPGEVAAQNTNNAKSRFLGLVSDWEYVYDPVAGQKRLISPLGKAAGIIASLDPYQYIGNKPVTGAGNIIGTQRTVGQPIGQSEAASRQTAGILYVTNQMPRGGGLFGLAHGVSSDGVTDLQDTRMLNFIAVTLEQILGQFVGELQSATDPKDATRLAARAAVAAFMQSLLAPKRQIDSYLNTLDTSNNTPTTVSQGFLIDSLTVKTLNAIHYAVAALQVGSNVVISTQPVAA